MSPEEPASDNAGITITDRPLAEFVRERPHMYFGATREDPELPAAVMLSVVADVLDEPAGTAINVEVVVDSDWRFSVTDDSPHHNRSADGTLLPGYFDTLLDLRRWAPAAAAALSVRTLVEVWADSCYRQELAGIEPLTPVLDNGPTTRIGTRVTFDLDRDYFCPNAVIPSDLDELRTGQVARTSADRGGTLLITDLRRGTRSSGRPLRPTTAAPASADERCQNSLA